MTLEYRSALSSRYCSQFMQALFSEKERAHLFRFLWVILAEIEHQLGLPITLKQIDEMKAHLTDIDLDRIREIEETTHHDVMAHILAFGEKAKSASKIIHLGATSCFVTDNADVLIYQKALDYLIEKFDELLRILKQLCFKYKSLPCVGYTHFQVAQPTTMGKRFSLWLQDLMHLETKLMLLRSNLKLLGIKGATGSQSSFYVLFDGNLEKIEKMEGLFEERLGLKSFAVSGQTYSRLQDSEILNLFAEIGSCFHKMGTDIRLLSHTAELSESFSSSQVGSSAMPHKKNPMLSERLCSLSRFLMQQSQGSLQTYSNQWLERSLDDSAIRRLIMPESFLALDATILLAKKILSQLNVNEAACKALFTKNLTSIAQEPILMHLSLKGFDRQKTHELLKKQILKHSEDLDAFIKALQNEENITIDDDFVSCLKDPQFYVAVCPSQVLKLVNDV